MSVFEWIVIGSLPIFLIVLLTIENALIKVGNRLSKQAEQQTKYLSDLQKGSYDERLRETTGRSSKELLRIIESHLNVIKNKP